MFGHVETACLFVGVRSFCGYQSGAQTEVLQKKLSKLMLGGSDVVAITSLWPAAPGSEDPFGATICSRDARSYRVDVTMTRSFNSYGVTLAVTGASLT